MTGEKWCLDTSGSTSHICKDPRLFLNSRETDSGVKLASDAIAKVTVKGEVRITVSDGTEDKSFLLPNTLYVLSLRTNLLSVAKIVDKGYSIVFD